MPDFRMGYRSRERSVRAAFGFILNLSRQLCFIWQLTQVSSVWTCVVHLVIDSSSVSQHRTEYPGVRLHWADCLSLCISVSLSRCFGEDSYGRAGRPQWPPAAHNNSHSRFQQTSCSTESLASGCTRNWESRSRKASRRERCSPESGCKIGQASHLLK